MRRAFIPVLALTLIAAPLALEAQTPGAQRGPFGAGIRAPGPVAVNPAAANPAARVLEHREALGLSPGQVGQLQQLQAQIEQRNRPLIDQVRTARPLADRDQIRQRAAQMTPAQRAQMRAQMEARRDRMQNATPEQRAQHRTEMEARREQMRNATPEQREQMRAQMREGMQARRGAGGTAATRQPTPEQRERMEALRPVMQQLRESLQQARRDVLAVLTTEQHAKLRELQARRGSELRQGMQRGERPAGPGRRGGAR
jgi:Spy/CpxP family protein refolding chaperone